MPKAKPKTKAKPDKRATPKAKAKAKATPKAKAKAKAQAKPKATATAQARPKASPRSTSSPTPKPSKLVRQLTEGAREAFTEARDEAAGERFYFFALFTTADGSYVAGTAATEEALASMAAQDAARAKRDLAESIRVLRFSAADSPYHDIESELLQTARGPGLHEACFEALAALDAEGFFGRGPERDAVIVNVVYGDMSDERWLAHAKRLNPEAAVARALPFLRLHLPSGDVRTWGPAAYQVNALSLSRDRTRLAYSGSGGELGVLDVKTHGVLFGPKLTRHHWASVIAPEGDRVFVGDETGVLVLDVAHERTTRMLTGGRPSWLALSPDGRRLAFTSWGGEPLTVRDADTGAVIWSADVDLDDAVFSPDGATLAAFGVDGSDRVVALCDAGTGTRRWATKLGPGSDGGIAFCPDGKTLLACAGGRNVPSTLALFDASTGALVRALPAPDDVRCVAWSPSGRRIALCARRTLLVLDLEGRELARGTGGHESLHACAFASETEVLAAGRDVNRGGAILALRLPP